MSDRNDFAPMLAFLRLVTFGVAAVSCTANIDSPKGSGGTPQTVVPSVAVAVATGSDLTFSKAHAGSVPEHRPRTARQRRSVLARPG